MAASKRISSTNPDFLYTPDFNIFVKLQRRGTFSCLENTIEKKNNFRCAKPNFYLKIKRIESQPIVCYQALDGI